MDELHQQTVNLLSFQQMPKDVFDSQVAFNLLPRFGSSRTGPSLEAIEHRVIDHYRRITRPPLSAAPQVRHDFGREAIAAARGETTALSQPEPAAAVLVPSLMLLHAPIFHSHALAAYVELENTLSTAEIANALAGEHVAVIDVSEEAPSNVTAAGQNEIQVQIRRDAQRDDGVWLWAAADNLKITALNAVACAESSAAVRPSGPIQ
jgi:aspartate-semialdehyde dehydrogenase